MRLIHAFQLGALIVVLAVAPAAQAATTPGYMADVRKQLSAAQRDLTKATVAARAGSAGDAVKAAQVAVNKARQDYTAALKAARQALASDAKVGPLQRNVRDLQSRLRDQSDAYGRLAIADELMKARNALSEAEWNVMGVDPDLAIGRADIDEAVKTLNEAVSRQQAEVQQDPAVVAARQRVLALRRQLRGR